MGSARKEVIKSPYGGFGHCELRSSFQRFGAMDTSNLHFFSIPYCKVWKSAKHQCLVLWSLQSTMICTQRDNILPYSLVCLSVRSCTPTQNGLWDRSVQIMIISPSTPTGLLFFHCHKYLHSNQHEENVLNSFQNPPPWSSLAPTIQQKLVIHLKKRVRKNPKPNHSLFFWSIRSSKLPEGHDCHIVQRSSS